MSRFRKYFFDVFIFNYISFASFSNACIIKLLFSFANNFLNKSRPIRSGSYLIVILKRKTTIRSLKFLLGKVVMSNRKLLFISHKYLF